MSQPQIVIPANNAPYTDLPPINTVLFEAKAKKGLTFDQIAKEIGKDEVWVAAAFYGQAKFTEDELKKVSEILGIASADALGELGNHWWPNRGLGPIPPQDPVIYRLYEGVLVYGHAIKAIIHEKFGDGIMSMIDCKINVEKKPDPKGDRVLLSFETLSFVLELTFSALKPLNMWQDPASTNCRLDDGEVSISDLFPESNFSPPSPTLPPPEGTLFVDCDLLQPNIFGEPLHASTNFAWDLPEHRFRNQYQEAYKASSKQVDAPTTVARETKANYELNAGPAVSSGGLPVLLEVPEGQKMPRGNPNRPSNLVKRPSFGVFAPIITKKKKTSVVGAAGSNLSIVATSGGSYDFKNKPASSTATPTNTT
ncbi:unnamed protein product [Cyclocybe aegerita]|uniref:Cyanate hydratase n=1 Tax=Cyclocybe aegerita TaxID=1973307 RepID=A0A8S0W995_CYCAE|nr:unnamed protein product [Cyclocybe aegerita]